MLEYEGCGGEPVQEVIYWKLDPMETYGDWSALWGKCPSVCTVCYMNTMCI